MTTDNIVSPVAIALFAFEEEDEDDLTRMETKVNKFIENKEVIDIKPIAAYETEYATGGPHRPSYRLLMVIYRQHKES